MKKYIIGGVDEILTIDSIIDHMIDNNLETIKITEAIRIKRSDDFFCSERHEICEKGTCGKSCEHYSPRNGLSWCCKFNQPVYGPGKKSFILNINGKKSKI